MELPNRLESEKLCAGLGKASTHSAANKHVHAVYCGRIAPRGMALGILLSLFLWEYVDPVVSIRRCITPTVQRRPLRDYLCARQTDLCGGAGARPGVAAVRLGSRGADAGAGRRRNVQLC